MQLEMLYQTKSFLTPILLCASYAVVFALAYLRFAGGFAPWEAGILSSVCTLPIASSAYFWFLIVAIVERGGNIGPHY